MPRSSILTRNLTCLQIILPIPPPCCLLYHILILFSKLEALLFRQSFLEIQAVFEVKYIYMFHDVRNSHHFISSLKIIHITYHTLSLIKIKSLIQFKIVLINGKYPHFSHSSLYDVRTLCSSEIVHQGNVLFQQYTNAYRRKWPLSPCKCVHFRPTNSFILLQKIRYFAQRKFNPFSHWTSSKSWTDKLRGSTYEKEKVYGRAKSNNNC